MSLTVERVVDRVAEVEPVWVLVLVVGSALAVLLVTACARLLRHKRWQRSMAAARTAVEHGRYDEAKGAFLSLLSQAEANFGPEDLRVASAIRHLGLLYHRQDRYTVAEPLLHRSLAILEKVDPGHIETAAVLEQLAELYEVQGKYAATELILHRSLAIKERALGPGHPQVMLVFKDLLEFYRRIGKHDEARQLEERAQAMDGRDKRRASLFRRRPRFWGSTEKSRKPGTMAEGNHAA